MSCAVTATNSTTARELGIASQDTPNFFGDNGNGMPLGDGISGATLDHETISFYDLWTSDPIWTSIGLVVLQLWWGQGNWKVFAGCFEI